MNTYSSLGVVIPSYKEPEDIATLVEKLLQFDFVAGIVVVDDTPDLSTVGHLTRFESEARFKVIHRAAKSGRGSAILDGLAYLRSKKFDYYLEMDADFSHDPNELPRLFTHLLDSKADLLIGSRYLPQSKILNWTLRRKIFSKIANTTAKLLLKIPVSDYTNGYRLYSKAAVDQITSHGLHLGGGFIALSEILVLLYCRGLKITEDYTIFRNRIRGESSLDLKEISSAAVGILKIWRFKKALCKKLKQ